MHQGGDDASARSRLGLFCVGLLHAHWEGACHATHVHGRSSPGICLQTIQKGESQLQSSMPQACSYMSHTAHNCMQVCACTTSLCTTATCWQCRSRDYVTHISNLTHIIPVVYLYNTTVMEVWEFGHGQLTGGGQGAPPSLHAAGQAGANLRHEACALSGPWGVLAAAAAVGEEEAGELVLPACF